MVDILENFPTILPRDDDAVFTRYVGAHEEEVADFEDSVNEIKLSRQVENSSGDDLDRVGRLFGPVGRRRPGPDGNLEGDEEYKQYLQAVVQAFSGRGTEESMELGISTALGIDQEDVYILNRYNDVEYIVVLTDWSAHNTDTIYSISEILDPSGVKQRTVSYRTDTTQLSSASVDIQTPITASSTGVSSDSSSFEVGYNPHSSLVITDEPTDDVEMTVSSVDRWDTDSWDSGEWDGESDKDPMFAFDSVDVTVTNV